MSYGCSPNSWPKEGFEEGCLRDDDRAIWEDGSGDFQPIEADGLQKWDGGGKFFKPCHKRGYCCHYCKYCRWF